MQKVARLDHAGDTRLVDARALDIHRRLKPILKTQVDRALAHEKLEVLRGRNARLHNLRRVHLLEDRVRDVRNLGHKLHLGGSAQLHHLDGKDVVGVHPARPLFVKSLEQQRLAPGREAVGHGEVLRAVDCDRLGLELLKETLESNHLRLLAPINPIALVETLEVLVGHRHVKAANSLPRLYKSEDRQATRRGIHRRKQRTKGGVLVVLAGDMEPDIGTALLHRLRNDSLQTLLEAALLNLIALAHASELDHVLVPSCHKKGCAPAHARQRIPSAFIMRRTRN